MMEGSTNHVDRALAGSVEARVLRQVEARIKEGLSRTADAGRARLRQALGACHEGADPNQAARRLLELGLSAEADGLLDAAFALVFSSLELLEVLPPDSPGSHGPLRVKAMIALATIQLQIGRTEQSISIGERARGLAQPYPAAMADTLNVLGVGYDRIGQSELGMQLLQLAHRMKLELNDPVGSAVVLSNIGQAISRTDPLSAIPAFEGSLAASAAASDPRSQAVALCGLAGAHSTLGNRDIARELLGQSLALRRKAGDRIGEATTWIELGALSEAMNNTQEALRNYRKAVEASSGTGALCVEAEALDCEGRMSLSLGDYERATECCQRAVQAWIVLGNSCERGQAELRLALVLRRSGQADAAVEHLSRSLTAARDCGDANGAIESMIALGEVHRDAGSLPEARDWLESALAEARRADDQVGVVEALRSLGDVEQQLGNGPEALLLYESALSLAATFPDDDREAEIGLLLRVAGYYSDQNRLVDLVCALRRLIALEARFRPERVAQDEEWLKDAEAELARLKTP